MARGTQGVSFRQFRRVLRDALHDSVRRWVEHCLTRAPELRAHERLLRELAAVHVLAVEQRLHHLWWASSPRGAAVCRPPHWRLLPRHSVGEPSAN